MILYLFILQTIDFLLFVYTFYFFLTKIITQNFNITTFRFNLNTVEHSEMNNFVLEQSCCL